MATRDETYQLILEKSYELFAHYGPRRTTVADIARELRMSPANVYKFYPSKDAIIEAVGEKLMADLHLQLMPIFSTSQLAWERIEDVMRAVNRYFTDQIESNVSRHGQQFFQTVIEFEVLKRERKWRFFDEFLNSTLRREIANLLREGAEKDGLRVDDAAALAATLLDCLSCSIEPMMLMSLPREAIEERLERQLNLLARAVR
jgi:AcrR family transcriptional regulator